MYMQMNKVLTSTYIILYICMHVCMCVCMCDTHLAVMRPACPAFGHVEHCFLTVWTPKSLCQNLLKMTFLRR